MTNFDLIKRLLQSFKNKDDDSFYKAALDYIEHEKRKKHTIVARELEKILYSSGGIYNPNKRFKNAIPIPRDAEKGFPLLEIQNFDVSIDNLLVPNYTKSQIEQIIQEFKDADIFATYNIKNKKKILLCGNPGTGKTFSARVISSVLQIPLVYVRFDSIISSYLGETASNLRKVFDFIESNVWIVLFDEFDIIGKNRDDSHEHGEIKRVVNNFLQMLDNLKGDSLILAATNHQHMLDPAIWRRFDDVLYFELPDERIRVALFDLYLRVIKKNSDIDLCKAASLTEGFSPADIKMTTEEAMKLSILDSRARLSQEDIEMSIERFKRRELIRNNQMGGVNGKA